MATPDLNGGARTIGVRLTEVPIAIRRRRGRMLYECAVADRDILLAAAINSAIERPSERIYWVSVEAARKVLG